MFGAIVATVENFALIPSEMYLGSFMRHSGQQLQQHQQHNTIRRQTNLNMLPVDDGKGLLSTLLFCN